MGSNMDQEKVLTTIAKLVTIALAEENTLENGIFSEPESTYTEIEITILSKALRDRNA